MSDTHLSAERKLQPRAVAVKFLSLQVILCYLETRLFLTARSNYDVDVWGLTTNLVGQGDSLAGGYCECPFHCSFLLFASSTCATVSDRLIHLLPRAPGHHVITQVGERDGVEGLRERVHILSRSHQHSHHAWYVSKYPEDHIQKLCGAK